MDGCVMVQGPAARHAPTAAAAARPAVAATAAAPAAAGRPGSGGSSQRSEAKVSTPLMWMA